MNLKLFCNHDRYDVNTWKYVNPGKYNQYIEAKVTCKKCGKTIIKNITGDTCRGFETAYEAEYHK